MVKVMVQVDNKNDSGTTQNCRSIYRQGGVQQLVVTLTTSPKTALPLPSSVPAFGVTGLPGTLKSAFGPSSAGAQVAWTFAAGPKVGTWKVSAPLGMTAWDGSAVVLTFDIDPAKLTAATTTMLAIDYPLGRDLATKTATITIVDAAPNQLQNLDLDIQLHKGGSGNGARRRDEGMTDYVAVAAANADNPSVVRIVLSTTNGAQVVASPHPDAKPVFTVELPLAKVGFGALSTPDDASKIRGFIAANAGPGYTWTASDAAPDIVDGGTVAKIAFAAPDQVLPTRGRVVLGLNTIMSRLPLPEGSDSVDTVVITLRWTGVPGCFDGGRTFQLERRQAVPDLQAWCDPPSIRDSGTVTLGWSSVGLDTLTLMAGCDVTYTGIAYTTYTPITIDPHARAYGSLAIPLAWTAPGDNSKTITFALTGSGAGEPDPIVCTVQTDLLKPLPAITGLTIDPYPAATGESVTVTYWRNNATFDAAIQRVNPDGTIVDCGDGDPLPTDHYRAARFAALAAGAPAKAPVKAPIKATAVCKAFDSTRDYRLLVSADINSAKAEQIKDASQVAVKTFIIKSVNDYLEGTTFQSDDDPSYRLDFVDGLMRLSAVLTNEIDAQAGVANFNNGWPYFTGPKNMRQVNVQLANLAAAVFAVDKPGLPTPEYGTPVKAHISTEQLGSAFLSAVALWEAGAPPRRMGCMLSWRGWTQIDRFANLLDRDFILASNIDFEAWMASGTLRKQAPATVVGVISRCHETLNIKSDGTCSYRLASEDDVAARDLLRAAFADVDCTLDPGPSVAVSGTWVVTAPDPTIKVSLTGISSPMILTVVGNAWQVRDGLPPIARKMQLVGTHFVIEANRVSCFYIDAGPDWRWPLPAPPPPPHQLLIKQELAVGQRLVSPNGEFYLTMQDDGNLCIYKSGNSQAFIFSSGLYGYYAGPGDYRASFGADGQLRIYRHPAGSPVWTTPARYQLNDRPDQAVLSLEDNGSLTINSGSRVVWRS